MPLTLPIAATRQIRKRSLVSLLSSFTRLDRRSLPSPEVSRVAPRSFTLPNRCRTQDQETESSCARGAAAAAAAAQPRRLPRARVSVPRFLSEARSRSPGDELRRGCAATRSRVLAQQDGLPTSVNRCGGEKRETLLLRRASWLCCRHAILGRRAIEVMRAARTISFVRCRIEPPRDHPIDRSLEVLDLVLYLLRTQLDRNLFTRGKRCDLYSSAILRRLLVDPIFGLLQF